MRLLLIFIVTIFCLSLSFNAGLKSDTDKSVWIESRIASMTLDQKISQTFIVLLDFNWGQDRIQETLDFVRLNSPGGVFVRGGSTTKAKAVIKELKNQSMVPVYVATEASYGLAESFFEKRVMPYPISVGAADSVLLTNSVAELIGDQCNDLGINLNLTHTVNVYSNPLNNKSIYTSFGENPRTVEKHNQLYFKSLKKKNISFVPMDFPGIGDVDLNENGMPVSKNPSTHIEAIDLMPFRSMIKEGAGMIGLSHAAYPSMDSTGTAATFSAKIIGELLRKKLDYSGIVLSASMERLTTSSGVKAYVAGCDLLLSIDHPQKLVAQLKDMVEAEKITMDEVDLKCRRILSHKYDAIIKSNSPKKSELNAEWTVKTVYEHAQVVVKNNGALPIQRFDQRIALISIGSHVDPLWSSISRSADIDCYHAYSVEEAMNRYSELKTMYDLIITSVHSNNPASSSGHLSGLKKWSNSISGRASILLIAGNAKAIKELDQLDFDAVLISQENHPYALDRLGELVMGCLPSNSDLSVTLTDKWKRGYGVKLPWAGRLSLSDPSVLGISSEKLREIDQIVNNGIENKAFPGCQVLVAVKGKVIYRRNFGYQTYDTLLQVKDNTIYDVASVTKVVSSTASVMRLQSQGQFDLNNSLGDYLSFVDSTRYEGMVIREMMAHQAGLYPWIPFYIKTMSGGIHDSTIYSPFKTDKFSSRVSTGLWIDPSYEGTMYEKILSTPLGKKSYKYSDLGYYFLKKIIEDKSGLKQDQYVSETFYKPMGLQTIGYNPLDRFKLDRIPPTEDDKIFRKELVHGYVHDQGTAMLGGVGGHAGIFSNSWDLAAVMQMFLNGGKYGAEFISEDVVNEFTGCQFCPANRRGAGFDKPVRSLKGGPTCGLVSLDSFGHSGFTGTFVWADPKYDINYVFLSNRVYPDAENWKIVSMNIRSDIQRVIYEAVLQGSNSN